MRTTKLTLGETRVELERQGSPSAAICLLHLHANERTALQAAARIVRRRPVRLLSLRHDDGRNLRFELDGIEWLGDPNRMFCVAGAERMLARLNPDRPAAARREAAEACHAFGNALLEVAGGETGQIVAAHNNLDDGDLTIHSFAPGANAEAIHVGQNHPSDFFLTTVRPAFDAIVRMDHHVVLEAQPDQNDGSLSQRLLSTRARYINVECRHSPRGVTAANELLLLDAIHVLAEIGAA